MDTVIVARKVDRIEIHFKNLFAAVLFGKTERTENFAHLALNCRFVLFGDILDKLLGNGRAAIAVITAGKLQNRAESTLPVHTAVFPKAFVFNGNKSICQILRHFVIGDPRTVLRAVNALIL